MHVRTHEKTVPQSVTLPARVARRVRALARARRVSASRVIVDRIESGLEAREQEKREYLQFLERLRETDDVAEQEGLTAKLAQLTFGA